MAIDPEELKKRRLLREKRRQAQRQRRRQLLLRLGLAALVLALVAGGIYLWSIPQEGENQPAQQEATQATQPTEPTSLPPTSVVHIAAAGDLNITNAVVQAGGDTYDYTQTFQDVACLLADADLAVLNFEGLLVGEPYGASGSAPQAMAEALHRAGVDLVQMANSYSISQGTLGLSTTLQNIRAAGMEPLGAYASNEEYQQAKGYTICEVEGVRIAFVAFTKGMNSMTLPAGSENCVNVLYEDYDSTYQDIDREKIAAVMTAVQQEEPDITIAMLHWGSEYNDTISQSQESIKKLFQSYGVDAIIGTHSHYVQKIEYDENAGTLVAYSLGDFLGDAERSGSEYSIILDMEITKDNTTGEAKITGYSYTPIFTMNQAGVPLRVVRLPQAVAAYEAEYINRVSKTTYEAMTYALDRVKARTLGE